MGSGKATYWYTVNDGYTDCFTVQDLETYKMAFHSSEEDNEAILAIQRELICKAGKAYAYKAYDPTFPIKVAIRHSEKSLPVATGEVHRYEVYDVWHVEQHERESMKSVIGRKEVQRALNELVGCPFGGWPETKQAISRLREELPQGFSAYSVIDAAMTINEAGRYEWRQS